MPQPPKRPPVTRQAHAGGVVISPSHIARLQNPEAVLPVWMGVDLAREGSDVTIIQRARCPGRGLPVLQIVQGQQDGMTAEQFRVLYEGRPEPCAINCQCKACVRYRREQESQP